MPFGVHILYTNFEHKNGGWCDSTASVLRRKPPRKSARKPRGRYAVFLVDDAERGVG